MIGIGYFIDPANTPVSGIDFNALKSQGITEVYYRVFNSDYNKHDSTLAKIKAAGLKPYVWVWQGFSHTAIWHLKVGIFVWTWKSMIW